MIIQISVVNRAEIYGMGYIAGFGDGTVTVGGKPAANPIFVYEIVDSSLKLIARKWSKGTGHYLFIALDESKEYLIMCRDHERQYEPFVWDYVKPMTDKTLAEQLQLWHEWQA